MSHTQAKYMYYCIAVQSYYNNDDCNMCRYWGSKAVMKRTWPYDMWSVGVTNGVVWLELLLPTPHVFQIIPRTAGLLQRHLHLHY